MTASPVRIAFVITELDEGGAERALVQIVTRLDRDRWEPRVFSLAGRGPLTGRLEEARIPVFDCGAKSASNPLDAWRALSKLKREFREWSPQIVQTFLFHANLLGRLAGSRAGVPHILSGIRVADRRGKWRLRLDRWTERRVEKHVCVSQSVADFSVRESGLDAGKIVVIPNGVDVKAFRDATPVELGEFGVPSSAKVVLSIGRLDQQKDPLTLLDAFREASREVGDAHLVFVGHGPLESQLQSRIPEIGLGERVHLVGWQRNVAGFLKAAHVFVLASRFEGMPNVLLEAGAAGVPVVATLADGVAEILKNEQCGWRVGIGDASALAQAITAALQDRDLATERANQLQSVVTEYFTWESAAVQYDRLYRSLLEHDSRSR